MNQQSLEVLAAANAANVEAMRSLAYTSLKATERLMNLNLGLARSSLQMGVDYAQPNGDWRNLLSQQGSGFQKSAEEAASYLRSVYDISSEAQAEVSELISSRVDDLSDSVGSVLDTVAKSAPAGSEKAVSVLKSAFADTLSAYAQIVRNGPQAAAANLPAVRKSKKAQ